MDIRFFEILALLFLILLNGIFAMSEIALVASRRARLNVLSESGEHRADRVLAMQEEPTRALSTIQVGITSIGVLSGIVGESALADPIAQWIGMTGWMSPETARWIGVAVVVVLVTYFSIVLGELVPKRLGQLQPEALACRVVGPLKGLSIVMAPFVKLLAVSTNFVLRLLQIKRDQDAAVTEEEIHAMIEEGSETGVIEENERDMVRNVFRLDDRQVGSVMIPRSDIEWIDLDEPLQDNVTKVLASGYSRLIVAKGSLDDVKGYCSTKAVLRQVIEKGAADFEHSVSEVSYVPESLTGLELLEHFKKSDASLALVVDEYGSVVGLVTPRDLLEAIAGEFQPSTNEDLYARELQDGSWIFEGIIAVPELKDELNIKVLPGEDAYSTLSGMIMYVLDRIPKLGDVVEWDGWRFEVVSMDGRRVEKVATRRLSKSAE